MKAVAIILLIATSAFALKMETASKTTQKTITELQKSKWGRTILEMAELHSKAGGAVQELVDGIEDLLQDLNEELTDLDFDFGVRTNEHNSLVIQLEQDIQDADIDIQRTDDTIENLLKPRRSQLKDKLAALQEYQAENRKNLDEATLVRGQEHDEFEALVSELNGATEAVDEALALLGNLNNPTLVQIKKFHVSLKKIENKIRAHSEHAALIKALISLASEQNFADQDSLRQIVNLLNEFRNAVVDAINDATLREQDEQEEYEEHVDQLNAEYAEFQRGINQKNQDLTAVQEKIDDLTAFISQREQDRKAFAAQLELENDQYAEETEIYTDLKNQYLREIATAEQALELVNSVDFSNLHV